MSVNQPLEIVKRLERTNDAFLGGKLSIMQPRKGFRAGMDSVLLGASVPVGARTILDLGAGVGVAAFTALTHIGEAHACLVEINPELAQIARDNAATNALSSRAQVIALDATAPGTERRAAGIGVDCFDVVIANPPYFGNGTHAPDPARAEARHMAGAELDAWVKAAVSSAHAQGEVIFIHLVEALPGLLAAFAKRMGGIAVLPIAARGGTPASRVLVRGRKGSRAPMRLLAPLVLHGPSGKEFLGDAEAIFRGTRKLDWRDTA